MPAKAEKSVIELPPEDPAVAVSLEELKVHHCRWPAGGNPMRYCGADKAAGSSYCARHRWISHYGTPK